jgi:hypothetical protein
LREDRMAVRGFRERDARKRTGRGKGGEKEKVRGGGEGGEEEIKKKMRKKS